MNPTSQYLARHRDRLADEPETPAPAALDTLTNLERRVSALERQVSGLELRMADAFVRERQSLRAEIDRLRTAAAAPTEKPKRTTTAASKKA